MGHPPAPSDRCPRRRPCRPSAAPCCGSSLRPPPRLRSGPAVRSPPHWCCCPRRRPCRLISMPDCGHGALRSRPHGPSPPGCRSGRCHCVPRPSLCHRAATPVYGTAPRPPPPHRSNPTELRSDRRCHHPRRPPCRSPEDPSPIVSPSTAHRSARTFTPHSTARTARVSGTGRPRCGSRNLYGTDTPASGCTGLEGATVAVLSEVAAVSLALVPGKAPATCRSTLLRPRVGGRRARCRPIAILLAFFADYSNVPRGGSYRQSPEWVTD